MRRAQVYKTVKRWTVTILNGSGERQLFYACHGIYTWPGKEEPESIVKAFKENPQARGRLAEIYGRPDAIDTMEATEVECWAGHFDPVRAIGPFDGERIGVE